MKKFKYPLAITGNQELWSSLLLRLIDLGYNETRSTAKRLTAFLVTNYFGNIGDLQFLESMNKEYDRTEVSASTLP